MSIGIAILSFALAVMFVALVFVFSTISTIQNYLDIQDSKWSRLRSTVEDNDDALWEQIRLQSGRLEALEKKP
jgi:hypothetical protein